LKSCNVSAELSRHCYAEAAEKVKAVFGDTLNIVDISEAKEARIVIKHIGKVMSEGDFFVGPDKNQTKTDSFLFVNDITNN
jgi:hypothetical protein